MRYVKNARLKSFALGTLVYHLMFQSQLIATLIGQSMKLVRAVKDYNCSPQLLMFIISINCRIPFCAGCL